MTGLLFSLIILVCILLVLVVLIQKPKGGGLTASMSAPSQLIGVARSSDVVEKITWGLIIALLVLSVGMNLGIDRNAVQADGDQTTQTTNSEAAEMAKTMPATKQAPATAPAQTPAPAPAQ
jgi:preprotein translocase subunit SecG